MNYKTMIELENRNQERLNDAYQIALSTRPAVENVDGTRRWLENDQVIEFNAPMFRGLNAEFSIKNQEGQSIWFSQLSKVAMDGDFKTPMYSTIKFKGKEEYNIASKFRNASDFWEAVRDKRFKVKVLGSGFIVNLKNPKATMIMKDAPASRNEHKVFDYVIDCINNGLKQEANGLILNYKIYALTEI